MEKNEYLSLSEAAKIAPGRPNTASLWRWCRKGVLSRAGERIRLEHIRAGARIFVTPSALDDFFRKLAESDAAYFDAPQVSPYGTPQPTTRSAERRAKDIEKARAELSALGL